MLITRAQIRALSAAAEPESFASTYGCLHLLANQSGMFAIATTGHILACIRLATDPQPSSRAAVPWSFIPTRGDVEITTDQHRAHIGATSADLQPCTTNFQKVIRQALDSREAPAYYNPDLLYALQKSARALDKAAIIWHRPSGTGPALVLSEKAPDWFGLVMPMRTAEVTAPAWISGVEA